MGKRKVRVISWRKEIDGLGLLEVFRDEEGTKFISIDGTKISRFDVLAYAVMQDDKDLAWEVLKFASKLFHTEDDFTFNYLYGAMCMYTAMTHPAKTEFYYQELFKKVYPKMENVSTMEHCKRDKHNIPDAWVLDNKTKEEIPVEVKRDNFNAKALAQLERYISTFECKHRIAVAQNLTVELPEYIQFVSIDELEAFQSGCESCPE